LTVPLLFIIKRGFPNCDFYPETPLIGKYLQLLCHL